MISRIPLRAHALLAVLLLGHACACEDNVDPGPGPGDGELTALALEPDALVLVIGIDPDDVAFRKIRVRLPCRNNHEIPGHAISLKEAPPSNGPILVFHAFKTHCVSGGLREYFLQIL